MKKEFTKRAGQIYALGIQHGFTYEELLHHLNESFIWLYSNKKQDEYLQRGIQDDNRNTDVHRQ